METVEVSYSPTVEDLVEFNSHIAEQSVPIRRRIRLTRVLGALIALLGMLLVLIWLVTGDRFALVAGAAATAIGIAYVVAARSLLRKASGNLARRLYLQQPSGLLLMPRTMTLSPEGIAEKTAASSSHVYWSAVTKVSTVGQLALLWISPVHAYVVPRRAFPDDAAFEAFLAFASEHASAPRS